MKPKKLGRGLSDILSKQTKPAAKPIIRPIQESPALNKEVPIKPAPRESKDRLDQTEKGVSWIKTGLIVPNRFQPRKEFEPKSLKELTDSVKSSGVIQPILVRASGKQYELIAGERRWRACKSLKMSKVPAIIKDADDRTLLEWAIIENTQRKDLNAIERARAYKEFAEVFGLTHEEVAKRMGMDRSTVTNFMRLLELPSEVQEEVSRGTISMGHARALLSVQDRAAQIKLAARIKREGMSVRRLEYAIRYLKRKPRKKSAAQENLYLKELEERLRRKFGTKVSITSYKSKGYITISFFSNDDFQRILELMEK